jgi:alpha-1,2-mannosyltransferase
MAGGVRNSGDEARVEELQSLISGYGLEKAIIIEKNISFQRIIELFETSSCGIHTMKDEHFGITCVDFQASGTLAVGHDSAGPKEDIFVDYKGAATGFLATDADSFADCMEQILLMPQEKRIEIQKNARNSCKRFSSEQFKTDFLYATAKLFK